MIGRPASPSCRDGTVHGRHDNKVGIEVGDSSAPDQSHDATDLVVKILKGAPRPRPASPTGSSAGMGALVMSGTLPPWFDTTTPSAPQSAARTASCGCCMPFTIS